MHQSHGTRKRVWVLVRETERESYHHVSVPRHTRERHWLRIIQKYRMIDYSYKVSYRNFKVRAVETFLSYPSAVVFWYSKTAMLCTRSKMLHVWTNNTVELHHSCFCSHDTTRLILLIQSLLFLLYGQLSILLFLKVNGILHPKNILFQNLSPILQHFQIK